MSNLNDKKHKSIIKHIHFTKMSFVLLVIGIAIGVLVTAQWRTQPTRASDPVVSYSSLTKTKEKLLEENTELKERLKSLNEGTSEAQENLKNYTNLKEKVEKVESYEEEAGFTEKNGEGVIINLDDSLTSEVNTESITHAADLRDIVNLLWGNGVEAIEINNERIVFGTSIDCIVNTILINSTKTTPPFKIKAIGDATELSSVLKNTNNLTDIKKRVATEGLVFEIEKKDNVNIKPYTGSMEMDYAKIE